MSRFTLSSCIEECLEHKVYIADILYKFVSSENPYKIVVDSSNKVREIYCQIAERNHNFLSWLNVMTMEPNNFMTIDVEIEQSDSELDAFLKVCAASNGCQKLIVNSHNTLKTHDYLDENTVGFCGKELTILDRDEAVEELRVPKTVIKDSIVADRKSVIKGVKLSGKK
ncbi:hypothetical protein [Paraglaciecola sp.]|uniref:hypothetical protein n=1 Tax=Paraglaciecola sp. TaxID=1920173 RepID=UPI003EF3B8A7